MLAALSHPRLAVVALLLSLAALPALARFFFGNWREFLDEAGLRDDTDRWLWLAGWRSGAQLLPQIVGFLGAYAALSWVVYETLAHLADGMMR